jgi:tetratricopeptide (TPR) repeat protein
MKGEGRGLDEQTLESSARETAAREWGKLALAVLGVVGCLGAIALLQIPQLRQLQTRSETASLEDIRRDLEAERVRLNVLEQAPSFGFDNVIADWTFLNFLQYFGDEAMRSRTDYALSPEYFDVILRRDPRFLSAYTFLSTSTAMYAGDPRRAIALTNEGLKHLSPTLPPDSHYVWRNKAIDELLFLGDAAAARQSFETAADWAEASGQPEGQSVASLSRQTATFLANNPDSSYAQFSAWMMVLTNAPDDRTRRTAADRIKALGGDVVPQPDGTFQIKPPPSD